MIATFEFDQNLAGKTLTVGFVDANSEPDYDGKLTVTTDTVTVDSENTTSVTINENVNDSYTHIQFLLYEEVEDNGDTYDQLVRTSKYIPIVSLNEEFNSVSFTDSSIEFNDDNGAILMQNEIYAECGGINVAIRPDMQLAGIDFNEDNIDLSGIEIIIKIYRTINGEDATLVETVNGTTTNSEYSNEGSFFYGSSGGSYINDYSDDDNQITYYCEVESSTPGVIIPKVHDGGNIGMCSS